MKGSPKTIKTYRAPPIRSKPGMGIKIVKKATDYAAKEAIPVRSNTSSALRTQRFGSPRKDYEPSEQYSPKSTQRIKSSRKPANTLIEDPDYSALRKDLMITHDFEQMPTYILNNIMVHLRYYSTDRVLARDYDEAEKADNLLEEARVEYEKRTSKQREIYSEDYEQSMHKKLDGFVEELDNFDQQTVKKREILENKQQEEFDKFEYKWKEVYPKKYRKPSTYLLRLMDNERKVGLTGNYRAARELKAKTDKQREIEASAAQEKLNTDYVIAREKFLEKQLEERNKFDESRAQTRLAIVNRQEQEMQSSINRGQVLTIKENMIKAFNAYKGNNSTPMNKFGTAQVLGEKDADVLLPPLTPPDYYSIKEAQTQKERQSLSMRHAMEEKLRAKDEEKKKRIDELLSTPAVRVPDPLLTQPATVYLDSEPDTPSPKRKSKVSPKKDTISNEVLKVEEKKVEIPNDDKKDDKSDQISIRETLIDNLTKEKEKKLEKVDSSSYYYSSDEENDKPNRSNSIPTQTSPQKPPVPSDTIENKETQEQIKLSNEKENTPKSDENIGKNKEQNKSPKSTAKNENGDDDSNSEYYSYYSDYDDKK